jgi:hypothetical protein
MRKSVFISIVGVAVSLTTSLDLGPSIAGLRHGHSQSGVNSPDDSPLPTSRATSDEPSVRAPASNEIDPLSYDGLIAFLHKKLKNPLPMKSKQQYWREYEIALGQKGFGSRVPSFDELKTLCRENVEMACWNAAMVLDDKSENSKDPIEKKSLLEQANFLRVHNCIEGYDESGCAGALEFYEGTAEHEKTQELITLYCSQGKLRYCMALETALFWEGSRTPENYCDGKTNCQAPSAEEIKQQQATAVTLSSNNCQSGILSSCEFLAVNTAVPDEDPLANQQAINKLTQSCEDGISENPTFGSACEKLAAVLLQNGDTNAANDYADQACDNGQISGCILGAKLNVGNPDIVAEYVGQYCAHLDPADMPSDQMQQQSIAMCLALQTNISGREFMNQYGNAPIITSNGTIQNLSVYLETIPAHH